MGEARYAAGVFVLALVGLGLAVLIVIGEVYGGPTPQGRLFWQVGGAALGGILIVYGLVMLLLRKMGLLGPRRAER